MKPPLIMTLPLEQLLIRWKPYYSLDNICELANQGYFGLYVKTLIKSGYSRDIKEYLKKLLKTQGISTEEKNYYEQLMEHFINFIHTTSNLLIAKRGYERLATDFETKIWPLCEGSSINRLIANGKIPFYEWGNAFGIVQNDNAIFSNLYQLHIYGTLTRAIPHNYKGHFELQDICVFMDQINDFESKFLLSQNKEEVNTNSLSNQLVTITPYNRCYEINYANKRTIHKPLKGIIYLKYLIDHPLEDIHVSVLESLVNKNETTNISFSELEETNLVIADAFTDEMVDEKTIIAVRNELENIQLEIDELEKNGDIEKAQERTAMKMTLEKYISSSTKLGYKPRIMSNNPNEKTRKRVSFAIESAIKNIKSVDEKLYQYLMLTIKKGEYCSYRPKFE